MFSRMPSAVLDSVQGREIFRVSCLKFLEPFRNLIKIWGVLVARSDS